MIETSPRRGGMVGIWSAVESILVDGGKVGEACPVDQVGSASYEVHPRREACTEFLHCGKIMHKKVMHVNLCVEISHFGG